MFNDKFLVFKKEAIKKEAARDNSLPDNILSYDHDSLNGYVRSVNQRTDDDFTSRLKNIARGR